MGTRESNRSSNGTSGSSAVLSALTAGRDLAIIISAFVVLTVLGIFVVQHYSTSDDAAAVLGVVIPAISTIAGTAFGVSAGVRAGAAVGDATAQAARTETETVRNQQQAMRDQTTDAYADLAEAKRRLEPVISAAASNKTSLPEDQLEEARTKLATAEESLKKAL